MDQIQALPHGYTISWGRRALEQTIVCIQGSKLYGHRGQKGAHGWVCLPVGEVSQGRLHGGGVIEQSLRG